MKVIKQSPVHFDKLGVKISVDDYVAYPDGNSMQLGVVKKLNPKMIGISNVSRSYKRSSNKYPEDCVVVEGSKVTMYLIKNSK